VLRTHGPVAMTSAQLAEGRQLECNVATSALWCIWQTCSQNECGRACLPFREQWFHLQQPRVRERESKRVHMVGANIQWKLLRRQQVSDGELELFHIHALGVRILRIATDTMSTDSVEPIDGHAGNSAQGCPALNQNEK
jgi:hypothetical protein